MKTMRRSSLSFPRSTRARTWATASAFIVLHMAKRSSIRFPMIRPVALSNTATPNRPPLRASSSSNSASMPRGLLRALEEVDSGTATAIVIEAIAVRRVRIGEDMRFPYYVPIPVKG